MCPSLPPGRGSADAKAQETERGLAEDDSRDGQGQVHENRWIIGTVGVMPQPVIVNAKLRNVPDKLTWTIDYNYGKIGRPTT